MNISDIFIRRPIATSLLMFAIALFGAIAYRALGVSDLPHVDFPTILVTANLPGANPDTMASAVATPLERQFSTIAGLDSMTSTNGIGATPDRTRSRAAGSACPILSTPTSTTTAARTR